ncbi:hypothetical protein OFN63_38695, partial [Escherichia coli]|nr:hypothetical protein [Escherichia coli]
IRDYSFKLDGLQQEGDIVTANYSVDTWLGEVELNEQSLYVSIKDDNLLVEEVTQAQAGAVTSSLPTTSLASIFLFALLGG